MNTCYDTTESISKHKDDLASVLHSSLSMSQAHLLMLYCHESELTSSHLAAVRKTGELMCFCAFALLFFYIFEPPII